MEKGGTMTISVNNPANSMVDIIIEDTGIGIPESDLQKIFDPFFSTKEGGTGLGLSTVFKIIENHNGVINVDSSVGKGTKVKISLPI